LRSRAEQKKVSSPDDSKVFTPQEKRQGAYYSSGDEFSPRESTSSMGCRTTPFSSNYTTSSTGKFRPPSEQDISDAKEDMERDDDLDFIADNPSGTYVFFNDLSC